MFINNPSANWWSAKMINRLGIDCLLHKTISLALLSTGFSPEQTLNIYQHGTAGAQPEWLSWDGTENISTRCSFTPSSNAPSASNIHHPPTERSVSCWQAFWERIELNCLLVYSQVLLVPLLRRLVCFFEPLILNLRTQAWMGLRNPCRDLDTTVWGHEGVVADFSVRFHVNFFLISTTLVLHACHMLLREERYSLILRAIRWACSVRSNLLLASATCFALVQRALATPLAVVWHPIANIWWREHTSCWTSFILHQ